MSYKTVCYSFILTITITFLELSLYAENVITDSVYRKIKLEEVKIQSSFKQMQGLQISPISASVINGRTLSNRNLNGIKDVCSMVPNLYSADYGSKLTSPVYIRGIGSKINSPSVGLYIDGIPYFEKSAFDTRLLDIERIEVLRGPQGTLYGRNTMGGIINVYTVSPLNHTGTRIKISEGTYNNFNADFSHRTMLSKKFGLGIAGGYEHGDGFFTNQYTGEKADRNDEAYARVRLAYSPNDRLSMHIISSLDWLDQKGYPYRVLNNDGTMEKVNYNRVSSYRRTMSTSGLNVIYNTSDVAINSQTSFQYLDDNQRIDQDFTTDDTYFATQLQTQKMLSQEISAKSTNDTKYKWLMGVFAFWQNIDNKVGLDYLKPTLNYTTLKTYKTPTWGMAVFHQSTYEVNKHISMIAGLRYDFEKAKDTYNGIKINHAKHDSISALSPSDFKSHMDFNQIMPKFSIQYTFRSQKIAYLSVSKGYKTGGFNTSFTNDEEKTFKPENSWTYEIGAKSPLCGGIITSEFCLFYINWKDQQIYQPLSTGTGQLLKNAGKSHSKGFEASISAMPTNGLVLTANYGFTHAKFKKYQRSATLDYSGNFLPLVPRHTINFDASYTKSINKAFIDRLSVNMAYNGLGKAYWADDNNIERKYYNTLNANFIIGCKSFSLILWAKNITNETYKVYYFTTGGKNYVQKGKPFTAGVSVSIEL